MIIVSSVGTSVYIIRDATIYKIRNGNRFHRLLHLTYILEARGCDVSYISVSSLTSTCRIRTRVSRSTKICLLLKKLEVVDNSAVNTRSLELPRLLLCF